MVKKLVIVAAFIILSLVAFVLYTPTLESKDLEDCDTGKYKPNSELSSHLKNNGYKYKHIVITETAYQCKATILLKKPRLILGTEIYTIELATVDKGCLLRVDKDGGDASGCVSILL